MNLRKGISENLKFRIDLQDPVFTVILCLTELHSKISSLSRFFTQHYGMLIQSFSRSLTLATWEVRTCNSFPTLLFIYLLAATLVVIYSESCQRSFPSFCAQASDVLFNWNLSRHSFLGQVIDLDLLFCTRFNMKHVDLFLCLILTQGPTNDQKIERSNHP